MFLAVRILGAVKRKACLEMLAMLWGTTAEIPPGPWRPASFVRS